MSEPVMEFATIAADGAEIDWLDPYLGHRVVHPGVFMVRNHYGEYQMIVPDGGRFEIRELRGAWEDDHE